MANRVPIISTPVAGIPELLQDGYNCFLTKGYRGEDIFEAFERYLSYRKNDKIVGIMEHAYECYLNNHSYESIGQQLEFYYEWICKKHDYRNADTLEGGVSDVRNQFADFLQKRCRKEMTSFTRKHIWFLYHIYKIKNMRSVQKVIIWGAGHFGEIAIEWLEILGCRDSLIGYIDTYKTGTYLGYPIIENQESAIKSSDMILLAMGDVGSCLENMNFLEQLGKIRNRDYFLMQNAPIRI